MKAVQTICRFVERHSSTILTFVAAAGTVGTGYFAAKGAIKASAALNNAEREKGAELTKLEAVKAVAPAYIPAAVTCASTIVCVFGANVLSRKQQASLVSAYALLENVHKEYKAKVKDLYGNDADVQVRAAIASDKIDREKVGKSSDEKYLFYEELSGQYFERTKEEVLAAEYHFNRNYILRGGYGCLNEFYEFLDLPRTDFGDALGWSVWMGEAFYGYTWVDFEHELVKLDDGLECYIISMPFPPTADYQGDPG